MTTIGQQTDMLAIRSPRRHGMTRQVEGHEAAMRYRRWRVPGGCAVVPVVVGAADTEVAALPSEARTTTFAPTCVRW